MCVIIKYKRCINFKKNCGASCVITTLQTQRENITLIEKTHSNVILSLQTVRWCCLTQNTGTRPLMYCPERTSINMCFGLVIVLANQRAHPLIQVLTMTSSTNLDKLFSCPELLVWVYHGRGGTSERLCISLLF